MDRGPTLLSALYVGCLHGRAHRRLVQAPPFSWRIAVRGPPRVGRSPPDGGLRVTQGRDRATCHRAAYAVWSGSGGASRHPRARGTASPPCQRRSMCLHSLLKGGNTTTWGSPTGKISWISSYFEQRRSDTHRRNISVCRLQVDPPYSGRGGLPSSRIQEKSSI